MMPMKGNVRGLATFVAGDAGVVEPIPFRALRDMCLNLGVREGDTVACRYGTTNTLVLDTQDRRTIVLARDWARFIRVSAPPEGLMSTSTIE